MPTTLEQLQYGFDRDSRRTWRQRATTQGWDNAYAYDSLSQVTVDDRGDLNLAQTAIAGIPANGARWDYDETGNWQGYQTTSNGSDTLNQSRTHDKGNRLMEVEGAAAMRTDRAGRMLQTVPGPQQDWGQSWQVTWDAWSRLTQVSHTEGNEIHRYGYDGITRRITRTNNQTGVTLRSFYNDQWRPVEERKNSETTASLSYLWGARHRDDLIRRDRAVGGTSLNETRYILMDYFSPSAITDEAGVVKERYAYSAFGVRTILNPNYTVRSSSECDLEFSFKGQFEDLETGWMNYGYRYYLPALGRWTRKDPIGILGGLNLYELTYNSPVNLTDYLGLDGAQNFLDQKLPNRDKAPEKEQSRKDRINQNNCIGGVEAMCGRKKVGDDSNCFKTRGEAEQLRDTWNQEKKCCKNGEQGPNGKDAQAIVWVLSYEPTNENAPERKQDQTITMPPRLPVTPTVPAFTGGMPTRTGPGHFDSAVMDKEGMMHGFDPETKEPYTMDFDDWKDRYPSFNETQYCVICEGNE